MEKITVDERTRAVGWTWCGTKAISGLVLCHVIASIMSFRLQAWVGTVGLRDMATMFFVGLVFCQVCLVALWASSVNSILPQITIAVVGALLAAVGLGKSVGDFSAPTWLIPITTIGVLLAALRFLRYRNGTAIRMLGEPQAEPSLEAIQFSIRQLMTLTFAVALLLAVARAVNFWFRGAWDLAIVATFAGCLLLIDVAALWAALGTGDFGIRLGMTTALTAAVMIGITVANPGRNWGFIFAINALCLMLSLSTLRASGYRFLRTE